MAFAKNFIQAVNDEQRKDKERLKYLKADSGKIPDNRYRKYEHSTISLQKKKSSTRGFTVSPENWEFWNGVFDDTQT